MICSPGSRREENSPPVRSQAENSRCWLSGRALMSKPKLLLLDEAVHGTGAEPGGNDI